jgi:catechol 2,3-dioxygenase-like lactoylglutathione lyase family enzyme
MKVELEGGTDEVSLIRPRAVSGRSAPCLLLGERRFAMISDKRAAATISVKDLDASRDFYEKTLGLKPADGSIDGVMVYASGDSRVLVYESQYAGTNRATTATWAVGDELDSVVADLKSKGVKFEHYDFPEGKREGDVHVFGKIRNAWFKDPDGNILSIVNGTTP